MLPYVITRDLADEHIHELLRQAAPRARTNEAPHRVWALTGRRLGGLMHRRHAAASTSAVRATGATSTAGAGSGGQPIGCVA